MRPPIRIPSFISASDDQVDDAFDRAFAEVVVRTVSKTPTVPAPPPTPSLLARARPSLEPAPGPSLDDLPPPSSRRSTANILAIYDRAYAARDLTIKGRGLRVHALAPDARVPLDNLLAESVVTTILDVALLASPRGGRVHFVTRVNERVELTVSFVDSSHFATEEPLSRSGTNLDAIPDVRDLLDGLRITVTSAGGELVVDSEERCSSIRVTLPRADGRALDVAA